MKGLRTHESAKFLRFWEMVQKKAASKGMIYFADCGEGNDFETDEMEGEDFCGWLIPLDKEKDFEPDWINQSVSDEWLDNMMWLEWKIDDGNVSIEFKNYE